jgi:tetratricopeptide (TPR) repeat protein
MPPAVGMRFGRYELLARLGAGGMGEVWRARDLDLHREVAVKFLPEQYAADPLRLERFATEARAASKLNHPNIVTVHEIGQASGLPFIVMELVHGETLRELGRSSAPRTISNRRLLDIGAQLADGLAKAHAAGIVHRDLKPENVMVTSDGFVKILDFGLAKLRFEMLDGHEQWFDSGTPTWPESPSPRTAAGVVLGTVGYMSPEQARGRPVDHRSDQFSLGVILYELATGRPAFRRETPAQTIAAVIEAPPPPLTTLAPGLPPPVCWAIERCLAKEPAERYTSTQDLARDLHNLRERLGEVGSSGSRPDAGVPKAWRRRTRGILAVSALLLMAIGVATALPSVRERLVVGLGLRAIPNAKRLAILPFRALGGGEEEARVAGGLAGLLTTRLAELERLPGEFWVEPASNVRQADVESAARAARVLGVTLALSGSVRRTEAGLSFDATLEDARLSRVLRATTASSQEELVREVIRMLDLELGQAGEAALRATSTDVAEAASLTTQALGYTPYTQGRSALERYEQSQRLERAIQLFNRALEQDPHYVLAHAGLGEAYFRLYLNEKRSELAALAERHCERAIAQDPLLAPAWITLGIIHTGTGRAETALSDFQKALDRDPRNSEAYRERGAALQRLGRFDEAEAAYRRAIELRPDNWANLNYLGAFLYGRGRLAEAETAFRRALALVPDNARVWQNLGAVLFAQSRSDLAKKALEHSLELQPSVEAASNLATVYFYEGRRAFAAETLARAVRPAELNYKVWQNLGAMYHWAPGERDRAVAAYRQAAELAERERAISPQPALLADLADIRAMLGDAAEARTLAAQAVAQAPHDSGVTLAVAGVHEQLGDRKLALKWLGIALKSGASRETIDEDPSFEALRADPGYAALVRSRAVSSPVKGADSQ